MAISFPTFSDYLDVGTAGEVQSQSTFSIVGAYSFTAAESNERNPMLYNESTDFEKFVQLYVNDIAAQGGDGRLVFAVRSPDAYPILYGTTDTNDGNPHWFLAVRNALNDHALYVDGNTDATDTSSDLVTAYTSTDLKIGRGTGGYSGAYFEGPVFRLGVFDEALTVADAKAFIYTGRCRYQPKWWLEPIDGGDTTPIDRSGNGVSFTPTGTPIKEPQELVGYPSMQKIFIPPAAVASNLYPKGVFNNPFCGAFGGPI